MLTQTTKRTEDALHIKNKKTGAHEVIKQYDIEKLGWGFRFFVDDELSAFKAAYLYRTSRNGVEVEYSARVGRWMVRVYNGFATTTKINSGCVPDTTYPAPGHAEGA